MARAGTACMPQSQDSSLPTSTPVRVLLVDDHRLVLWALERLLQSAAGEFIVVGQTSNAGDVLRLARETHPDIVLLGLAVDGAVANLLPRLVKVGRLRVVALAGPVDEQTADHAVLAGARGLVRRGDDADSVLKAMRKVRDGELWLDRATSGRIFGMLTKSESARDSIAERIARLTERERNIIGMVARSGSARHREVAGLLGLSEHTLRNHLSRIYAKLELSGHFELYLYAKRYGLDQAARA